jgi:GNAT superfamily N-acetyltransferase
MIRKAKSENDWKAIRKICCETGKSGSPIEHERWDFFGENWIGPYQTLLPHWAWVATEQSTDELEHIIGYLTGCPNSAKLERSRVLRFDLPLLFRISQKRYPYNADVRRYLKRRFYLEKSPEQLFPENIRSMLATLYPAHLHINLSEKVRGSGVGRKLIDAYFEALRESRICGVHVFCGDDPVRFYERMGFQTLHTLEFRPGVWVHCMATAL